MSLEADARVRPARIDGLDRLALDTRRGEIDDRQHNTALALGSNDGNVGNVAIGNGELLAAQGAATQGGAQLAHIGLARPFRDRQRADRLARRQLRQPGLLLRLAAAGHDGLAGEIDRGRERHRRQRGAQLLRQHTQAQMPETGAAIRLRDRRPGPAHGSDLLPQRLVVGLRPLEDLPHRSRWAALAQEFARLLAQLFQVIAEIEVHARRPDGDQPYTRASVPAHQRGPIAVGEPIGDAEGIDPLLVGQQCDSAGPIGAPHAAIEAEGIEDARQRIPDVLVRVRLARERAGAGDLNRDVGVLGELQHLRQVGKGLGWAAAARRAAAVPGGRSPASCRERAPPSDRPAPGVPSTAN